MTRDPAARQRPHPHAEHIDRHRDRREAAVGRQHRTHNRAGRDQNDVVAAGQRLCTREDERIAPGEPVAGGGVHRCVSERRHILLPDGACGNGLLSSDQMAK
jgi:hypothetical protein